MADTRELYNQNAKNWVRREPNSLSDFTGRPAVFDLCGDVRGLKVADLGSGEGYCTREMAARGASELIGIELSEQMVALAREQEKSLGHGIEYSVGDITKPLSLKDNHYDLVLAVFVFNYLDSAAMRRAMREIYRITRPSGHFVFSIPHPSFPFMREKAAPFYFDFQNRGYFSGKDSKNEGEIYCRDGTALRVQMIHKPLEDFFDALREAGFTNMPVLRELRVTEDHLRLIPEFFGPIADIPLHMAFKVQK